MEGEGALGLGAKKGMVVCFGDICMGEWEEHMTCCTLPLVRSYQPLQETHSRPLRRRVPSQVIIAITVMVCYAANSPSIGNKLAGQRQLKRKALALAPT